MSTILKALLLRSIPLDHQMKRYFISKYRFLRRHNGDEYALKRFKDITHYLMSLRTPVPVPCPVRRTGWMKRLEANFLSHPHWVLNFLKFFNNMADKKTTRSVGEDFSVLLQSLKDEPVPRFVKVYRNHLRMDRQALVSSYNHNRSNRNAPYFRYCSFHSLREWLEYWNRVHHEWTDQWNFGVNHTPLLDSSAIGTYQVSPMSYPKAKDPQGAYEVDVFYHLRYLAYNTDLTQKERTYLRGWLSPDALNKVDQLKLGRLSILPVPKLITNGPFGTHAGQIHFVQKGTNDFRPIAVPNRFLQETMEPVHKQLVSVVRRKELKDASFKQHKFNNVIQSRVNTDDRFVGSIDLKNATERLPLSWFIPMEELLGLSESSSWSLFIRSAREVWNLNGKRVSWKRGQPLGTLPSFQVLSLTHHLILEALSLEEGYGHRPYRILGDDLVVFSKRLYRRYEREAQHRNILLSKQKTFYGSIAQFAGQTFIKNCIPFMTPDQGTVYKTNLFDWSYATGIRLRWRNLPRTLKQVFDNDKRLFENVQTLCVFPRGTSRSNWSPVEEQLLVDYFACNTEVSTPDLQKVYGWVMHQGWLTVVSNMERKRDELFTRYRSTNVPGWFEQKFRPAPVDTVLAFARKWFAVSN